MKNKIIKKIIVLLSLSFVIFSFNFVRAADPDTTAPSIMSFVIPVTSTSLDISISSFVATDDIGVSAYDITENPTAPLIDDAGWVGQVPSSYTFSSEGSKTLYAWAKDAAGNISIASSAPIQITLPDITAPTITSFTVPTTSTSLAVSVTFSATDTTGVTGYKLTETSQSPLVDDTDWLISAPTSYTFSSEGSKTLYAWAKDAAGNISASSNASVQITLETSGGGSGDKNFSVNQTIVLPDNCLIKDIGGKTHVFPQETSVSKFLGICALSESKNQGAINDFKIIEYPFGLFVDSINNMKSSTAYWALYLNDGYESRGLTDLPLVVGDKVSLVYVDFNNVELGSRVDIRIGELSSSDKKQEQVSSSGSVMSKVVPLNVNKEFSVKEALDFLSKNQKENGSFGSPLYTDWAAVGVATTDNKIIKEKITKYLKENDIETVLPTDNERRAMALMSLGVNPYIGTKVNYIKKIVDSFDGTQFGDKDLYNDDIFALIVLKNAGYVASDEIISKDIQYLISQKEQDGSWGSIDMTAAYVEAMKGFENIAGVKDSVSKSESYITSNQKNDGGFENSSSTAWVLQSLFSNEQILKAEKYLALKQDIDGGVGNSGESIDSRVWATAYTVPAILHKTWGEILYKFPKQDTLSPKQMTVLKTGTRKEIISNYKNKKTEDKQEKLELLQRDILKPEQDSQIKEDRGFFFKVGSFWQNTKHSFGWLFGKLSF